MRNNGMVVVGWLGRGTTTLHCTHHALSHRLKVLSIFSCCSFNCLVFFCRIMMYVDVLVESSTPTTRQAFPSLCPQHILSEISWWGNREKAWPNDETWARWLACRFLASPHDPVHESDARRCLLRVLRWRRYSVCGCSRSTFFEVRRCIFARNGFPFSASGLEVDDTFATTVKSVQAPLVRRLLLHSTVRADRRADWRAATPQWLL